MTVSRILEDRGYSIPGVIILPDDSLTVFHHENDDAVEVVIDEVGSSSVDRERLR